MPYKIALGILALALAATVLSGILAPQGDPNRHLELDYAVRPVPGDGFDVELRAIGLPGRKPVFRLLDGWGLLQDQGAHLSGFRAETGAGVPIAVSTRQEDGEALWRLAENADTVLVRYRVSPYDPHHSPEASFATSDRFVLVGYSLFPVPDGIRHFDPLALRVRIDAPDEWPQWASWPASPDGYRPPTAHDLWSGTVAGGSFRATRLTGDPVSVTVLTDEVAGQNFGLTVANRLLRVLRGLVDLFGAPPAGDSLDMLALFRTMPGEPGVGMLKGSSEERCFLALATPDRYSDVSSVLALAVHESVHFYLGSAVASRSEPPYRNSPDLIWLMEGMVEYLTFRLMRDAGAITTAEYREVVLSKDQEYRACPGAKLYSLADAARRMEDVDAYPLVYSRGFLVARLLEEEMDAACGAGSLDRALRRIFDEHRFDRTGKPLSPKAARRVFAETCPAAEAVIARYALEKTALPAPKEEPAAEPVRAIAARRR